MARERNNSCLPEGNLPLEAFTGGGKLIPPPEKKPVEQAFSAINTPRLDALFTQLEHEKASKKKETLAGEIIKCATEENFDSYSVLKTTYKALGLVFSGLSRSAGSDLNQIYPTLSLGKHAALSGLTKNPMKESNGTVPEKNKSANPGLDRHIGLRILKGISQYFKTQGITQKYLLPVPEKTGSEDLFEAQQQMIDEYALMYNELVTGNGNLGTLMLEAPEIIHFLFSVEQLLANVNSEETEMNLITVVAGPFLDKYAIPDSESDVIRICTEMFHDLERVSLSSEKNRERLSYPGKMTDFIRSVMQNGKTDLPDPLNTKYEIQASDKKSGRFKICLRELLQETEQNKFNWKTLSYLNAVLGKNPGNLLYHNLIHGYFYIPAEYFDMSVSGPVVTDAFTANTAGFQRFIIRKLLAPACTDTPADKRFDELYFSIVGHMDFNLAHTSAKIIDRELCIGPFFHFKNHPQETMDDVCCEYPLIQTFMNRSTQPDALSMFYFYQYSYYRYGAEKSRELAEKIRARCPEGIQADPFLSELAQQMSDVGRESYYQPEKQFRVLEHHSVRPYWITDESLQMACDFFLKAIRESRWREPSSWGKYTCLEGDNSILDIGIDTLRLSFHDLPDTTVDFRTEQSRADTKVYGSFLPDYTLRIDSHENPGHYPKAMLRLRFVILSGLFQYLKDEEIITETGPVPGKNSIEAAMIEHTVTAQSETPAPPELEQTLELPKRKTGQEMRVIRKKKKPALSEQEANDQFRNFLGRHTE